MDNYYTALNNFNNFKQYSEIKEDNKKFTEDFKLIFANKKINKHYKKREFIFNNEKNLFISIKFTMDQYNAIKYIVLDNITKLASGIKNKYIRNKLTFNFDQSIIFTYQDKKHGNINNYYYYLIYNNDNLSVIIKLKNNNFITIYNITISDLPTVNVLPCEFIPKNLRHFKVTSVFKLFTINNNSKNLKLNKIIAFNQFIPSYFIFDINESSYGIVHNRLKIVKLYKINYTIDQLPKSFPYFNFEGEFIGYLFLNPDIENEYVLYEDETKLIYRNGLLIKTEYYEDGVQIKIKWDKNVARFPQYYKDKITNIKRDKKTNKIIKYTSLIIKNNNLLKDGDSFKIMDGFKREMLYINGISQD